MSDLERILRRGRVEIENTEIVAGYTPYEEHADGRHWQTAIVETAVKVKWWANRERKRASENDVYRRFRPKDRISMFVYFSIFGDDYYEATKPTLADALADVELHTRPAWRDLDALVMENETTKQGAGIVGGLIAMAS